MPKRKSALLLSLFLALLSLAGCTYEDTASPTAAYDGAWYFAQNGAQCQFGDGLIYRDDKTALDGQTLTGIYSAADDHIDANLAGVGGVDQVRSLYLVDSALGDLLCDSADGTGTVYFYREATAVLAALETRELAPAAGDVTPSAAPAPSSDPGQTEIAPLELLDPETTSSPSDARALPGDDPSPTPAQSAAGNVVWVSQSGTKYHSTPSCSGMKNPKELTLSQAQSKGYTPCKRCYG